MKFTRIIFAFTMASFTASGQQESQFIHTVNNPYLLNPAATGFADVMQFELTSRTQWLGYNGPQTFQLMGSSRVKIGRKTDKVLSEFNVEDNTLFSNPKVNTGTLKHIVGGRVLNDAIGPFGKTSLFGSYAIHLPFTENLNFGAGIGVGWSNFRINQDRVVLYQQDDASYSQFLGTNNGQNILDANAGLVFYNSKFMGGFSMTQAFRNKARFTDVTTDSYYNRHYFLVARYRFDFENDFSLEPSVLAKFSEHSPASLDAGLRLGYRQSAWLGAQYRTSNAVTLQLGANIIKNMYLMYGYEIGTGKIRTAGNGTHEVQLGIYIGNNRNINKEIKGKKEKEPGH